MPTEIPKPPPGLVVQMDRLHAACEEILDRYINGFDIDLSRHAVKHGDLDASTAHYHLTKILAQQVPANMLAGMAAAAIIRGMQAKPRKRK